MTKTKKKRRLKSKRKNRTKHKLRSIKGGEIIGEGAYGIVTAYPRIICENEPAEDANDNNATKLFFANNGKESVQKEEKVLNYFDKDSKFGEYCALPIKTCKPDLKHASAKRNIQGQLQYYKDKVVVYPLGKRDLFAVVEGSCNMPLFYKFFNKLANIGYGVALFQTRNIIHGDLRLENCVEFEEHTTSTFKIIDLGDLSLEPMQVVELSLTRFGNIYVSPLVPIYYAFQNGNPNFTFEKFKTYMKSRDMLRNFNCSYFQDDVETVFFCDSPIFNKFSESYITELLKQRILFKFKGNLVEIEKKSFTSLQSKFENYRPDEWKLNLIKYCDRYSFGIMILAAIQKFLFKAGDFCQLEDFNDGRYERLRDYINQLIEIVYRFCDIYNIEEFNVILTDYVNTVAIITEKTEYLDYTKHTSKCVDNATKMSKSKKPSKPSKSQKLSRPPLIRHDTKSELLLCNKKQ